jgi:hypothetical protein
MATGIAAAEQTQALLLANLTSESVHLQAGATVAYARPHEENDVLAMIDEGRMATSEVSTKQASAVLDTIDINIGCLTPSQCNQARAVLTTYSSIFAAKLTGTGPTTKVQHTIDVGQSGSVSRIRPSHCPWVSGVGGEKRRQYSLLRRL